MIDLPGGGWLVGLLALTLVGGLFTVLRACRRFALLVIWCALLWVPLTLLSGLIDPSQPKLRLQLIRYWLPIFPAIALGGLGLLWLAGCLVRDRMRDRMRTGSVFAALAAALPLVLVFGASAASAERGAREWWLQPGTRASGATQLEAFRSWMSHHGTGVRRVWADERTVKVLRIYQYRPFGGLAWHARARLAAPGAVLAPGDLVLFYDAQPNSRLVCGSCRRAATRLWGAPPRPQPGWREVHASRDGVVRVYSVIHGTTIPRTVPGGRHVPGN